MLDSGDQDGADRGHNDARQEHPARESRSRPSGGGQLPEDGDVARRGMARRESIAQHTGTWGRGSCDPGPPALSYRRAPPLAALARSAPALTQLSAATTRTPERGAGPEHPVGILAAPIALRSGHCRCQCACPALDNGEAGTLLHTWCRYREPAEERQLWPSSDRSWGALSNVGRPGWLPGSRESRPAEPLARRTAQTPSGQRSGADGAPSCSAECPRLEHCRSTRHGRVAVSVRRCPGARQCSGAMRASARRPPVTGRGFCSDALCRSWDWVWSRSPMGIGCAGLLCSSSLGAESELDNRPDLYV
jgi:hypothetical protein